MRRMKLRDLAAQLGATLHGDGETEITGVAGIEEAAAGQVTFVSNPRYAAAAKTTRASAVLVAPEFPEIAAATLRLANPYLAFAKAIGLFHPSPVYPPGVHSDRRHRPHSQHRSRAHISAPMSWWAQASGLARALCCCHTS